jgi:hypothetical protein
VDATGCGMDGTIHLVDHLLQLEVSILRRKFELQHEPVELVDEEYDGQLLVDHVANEALSGR